MQKSTLPRVSNFCLMGICERISQGGFAVEVNPVYLFITMIEHSIKILFRGRSIRGIYLNNNEVIALYSPCIMLMLGTRASPVLVHLM